MTDTTSSVKWTFEDFGKCKVAVFKRKILRIMFDIDTGE